MKINCVIVTYNRLRLLKENIEAVKSQTFAPNQIFIINNNSTDGTADYLNTLTNDSQITVIHLPENIGGAGGFTHGIKKAIEAECEWIWVMDDDTIPTPDTLQELVEGTKADEKVGFVCSKVVWTDGMVHKMNLPFFDVGRKDRIPLNYFSNQRDVLLAKSASFVSLLIKTQAVYEVGLPISEFFIWGDDIEFTSRIYDAGYFGIYAPHSVALHKTAVNYVSEIHTAPIETLWKFYYDIRNSTYLRSRRKNRFIFVFSTWNAYRRAVRKVRKRPVEEHKAFIQVLRKGFWKGLSFKPQIEYLTTPKKQ
ncbi:MAG: glycosyltransferase family 2 protein [Bacteroidales bacterium]